MGCRVCLIDCEPSIHAATVSVHEWLRERVTFQEPLPVEGKPLRVEQKAAGAPTPFNLNRVDKLGSERRVGRPRKNPPKAHPFAGRGKAWNRKESVTDEQIRSLHEQGWSFEKIGAELKIHPSTAFKRLKARTKEAIA